MLKKPVRRHQHLAEVRPPHLLAFMPRPRILKLAVSSWDKKRFEIGHAWIWRLGPAF